MLYNKMSNIKDLEIIQNICEDNYTNIKNLSKKLENFLLEICTFIIEHNKKYVDKAILINKIFTNKNKYINTQNMPIATISPNITELNLLSWTGNSCYLDSVLISLLLVPNKFIDNFILSNLFGTTKNWTFCKTKTKNKSLSIEDNLNKIGEIQDELRSLVNDFRQRQITRPVCTKLRSLFKNCNNTTISFYWLQNEEDSIEFLNYILSMFIEEDISIQEKTVNILNDDYSFFRNEEKIREKGGIVINIKPEYITSEDLDLYLSQFLIEEIQVEVRGEIAQTIIKKQIIKETIYSPYIIFTINRKTLSGAVNSKKFIPNEHIKLKENINNLSLHSVVVYNSHHYTCYFLYNTIWYYYNDLDHQLQKIGNYNKLISRKTYPNVLTNGTIFFYKQL
jgi:hypothetical protein